MRAVVYARYSSDQQSASSIEDQLEVCRRYIDGQRWTLVRSYEDRAISGGSAARPGFQALLADAERGAVRRGGLRGGGSAGPEARRRRRPP